MFPVDPAVPAPAVVPVVPELDPVVAVAVPVPPVVPLVAGVPLDVVPAVPVDRPAMPGLAGEREAKRDWMFIPSNACIIDV